MSQGWYIDIGGQVEGPISPRELRERAAAGRLRPTDKISPDGKKWAPAAKVKGLTFAEAKPPAEPPATLITETPPVGTPSVAAALPPQAAAQPKSSQKPQSMVETMETSTEQIPGYEILGVLGKGACGVVFRARQVKLDRIVALKTVLTDRKPTAAALARFDKEAVSLAKLRHPNIVGVFDCGHNDGQAFFAMELLDGEDLGNRIDTKGPLDEFTAWHIARQTAAALAHAAELGVFHRDIKPANLFLTPPPTGYPLPPGVPLVKVTDFGLALTRQGAESGDQRLTAAGVVLGTPAYMPPEQFAGSDIDQRADVYALGATMYHVLTGRPPFDGGSIWEVMLKKAEPTPVLGDPISPESSQLVAHMMASKVEDRIGSYRELLERIDSLSFMRGTVVSSPSMRIAAAGLIPTAPILGLDTEQRSLSSTKTRAVPASETEPVATPAKPKSKKKLYAIAAAGLAIVGAAASVAILGGDKPQPTPPGSGTGATKKATEFVAGETEALFDRQSLLGWTPVGGVAWVIEEDDEKTTVITGKSQVRRPFRAAKNFRVILGVDLHEAAAAEVVAAVADDPPETAKQWIIRIDRAAGAVFGTREGAGGELRPLGASVPIPTKMELEDEAKRPYQEVKYERAGGKLRASYRTRPLGEVDDDGKMKTSEVRVRVEGGPIRIDTAFVEELVEKP
jgi:serine/threonine protein kinase